MTMSKSYSVLISTFTHLFSALSEFIIAACLPSFSYLQTHSYTQPHWPSDSLPLFSLVVATYIYTDSYVYVHTDTFLNIPCSVHIMWLDVCFQGWAFGTGQPIGCSFLGTITYPAPNFLQLPTVLCRSVILFYMAETEMGSWDWITEKSGLKW